MIPLSDTSNHGNLVAMLAATTTGFLVNQTHLPKALRRPQIIANKDIASSGRSIRMESSGQHKVNIR